MCYGVLKISGRWVLQFCLPVFLGCGYTRTSSGASLGSLGPRAALCLYASVCWLLTALDSSSSVVRSSVLYVERFLELAKHLLLFSAAKRPPRVQACFWLPWSPHRQGLSWNQVGRMCSRSWQPQASSSRCAAASTPPSSCAMCLSEPTCKSLSTGADPHIVLSFYTFRSSPDGYSLLHVSACRGTLYRLCMQPVHACTTYEAFCARSSASCCMARSSACLRL